jgi:UDP-2,4-diacetamido-2,4,6-trideoxy-beta-L-altropyranose hydrolase
MDLDASTRGSGRLNAAKILIRVDSSNRIGTGHVSRCLRVANDLKRRGGEVAFVCAPIDGNVSGWISDSGFQVLNAGVPGPGPLGPIESSWPIDIQELDGMATIQFALDLGVGVVLVDHYGLDSHWEGLLNHHNIKVIAIDDLDSRDHLASVVIRPGPPVHTSHEFGQVASKTMRLSGPRYAIVSEQFCDAGSYRTLKLTSSEKRVLTYFGGVDETNFSECIVDALLDAIAAGVLPRMTVELVLGSASSHKIRLEQKYDNNAVVRLRQPALSLAPLMAECDIAIGAGGVTALERAAAGLPSIVFSLAANQIELCRALQELGLAVYAGRADEYQEESFIAQFRSLLDESANQKTPFRLPRWEIDCLGPKRIAEIVMPSQLDQLSIKPAGEGDIDLYFGWVNDPLVREQSITTGTIAYDDHSNWFRKSLVDPETHLLLIKAESLPVGQVRFFRQGKFWELNYSLDEIFRGRGWAKHIVKLALNWLRINGETGTIRAKVRDSNQASLRVLIGCGFIETTNLSTKESGITHLEFKSRYLNW